MIHPFLPIRQKEQQNKNKISERFYFKRKKKIQHLFDTNSYSSTRRPDNVDTNSYSSTRRPENVDTNSYSSTRRPENVDTNIYSSTRRPDNVDTNRYSSYIVWSTR
jgi:hypothetical protein